MHYDQQTTAIYIHYAWRGTERVLGVLQEEKDLGTIEKVQRRATKLTSDLKNLEYPDRLWKLKLPSLAYRRLRDEMIQAYNTVDLIGIKKENLSSG